MSVLNELASAIGRRDEVPNQELAAKILKTNNSAAIKELAENLANKSKDIQFDCVKTLYEIGAVNPKLVVPYTGDFIKLLTNKYPRMIWGAMTALSALVQEKPDEIYTALPQIMNVADNSGSVIARDHAMYILAGLAKHKKYYEDCLMLIQEQLMKAPVNQLPMYAEVTAPVITEKDKESYKKILAERLEKIDQESKRKRIEKVLKKLR